MPPTLDEYINQLPARDATLPALQVGEVRDSARLVHTLMRSRGLSYRQLSTELFRIDQPDEEMKRTGQKFLSDPVGPYSLFDRMMSVNGKFRLGMTAWAGGVVRSAPPDGTMAWLTLFPACQAAVGIRSKIIAACTELRHLLASPTKTITHAFFSGFKLRTIYEKLVELLPISFQALHAIARTSEDEPADPRHRRGVAPGGNLSTPLGALGDDDAPGVDVVDGMLGFTPIQVGEDAEWQEEETPNFGGGVGSTGPLPRKLRVRSYRPSVMQLKLMLCALDRHAERVLPALCWEQDVERDPAVLRAVRQGRRRASSRPEVPWFNRCHSKPYNNHRGPTPARCQRSESLQGRRRGRERSHC